MTTFRVTRFRGSVDPPITFRVTRLRGTVSSSGTFRLTSLRGSSAQRVTFRVTHVVGTAGTATATITWPDMAAGGDLVTIDASGSPGPYSFVQTAGPSVVLTVVGGVATYEAPDLSTASDVTITVTAGAAVAAATTTITPTSEYDLQPDGTWEPRRRTILA